jgi:hypothetical protein
MKAGILQLVWYWNLVVFRGNTILVSPTSQHSPVENVNDMEGGGNADGAFVDGQIVYLYY